MEDGKRYRAVVTKALRHLGHTYGNPPTSVIVEKLRPFIVGDLGKSKASRRRVLMEAARRAMQQPAISNEQKPSCAKSQNPTKRKVARDGFYSTWGWNRARYEAIRIHGQRCQCCGWTPSDTKSGWLVVDHIKPRSKFPDLALDVNNLQVLCNDCNMGKSNVYEDYFRSAESWLASICSES